MKDAEREARPWADVAKAVERAFVQFADAVGGVAEAIRRALTQTDPAVELARRRNRYGGMGVDALRWPDRWYSTQCTAWLCAECPSDERGLSCQCPHHRGVKQ